MKKFFNFDGREGIEQVMRETWDEFRVALAKGEISPNEIEKAKKINFLKVYNDMFLNSIVGSDILVKSMDYINNFIIGRGANLQSNENVGYGRFIPNSKYIKKDNRFSPIGVEWLYLAIGSKYPDVQKCAEKECRAEINNRFGFCDFKINEKFLDNKIVDLTIADDMTFDNLNEFLEKYGKYCVKNGVQDILRFGKTPVIDEGELKKVIEYWVLCTYTKLLSEQIFVPIESNDKKYEYSPFQTIANYFQSLGYIGIIYRSTVCSVGRNIVLFDKNIAQPFGSIKDYIIKQ